MKPSQNLLSWQVFVATCRTRSISQAAVLLDIDLPKASRLLSCKSSKDHSKPRNEVDTSLKSPV